MPGARELGISSESLRGWVKKARAAQEAGSVSAGRAGQSAPDRDCEWVVWWQRLVVSG